jgi:immunoglobulin-binding protein 1
MLADLLLKSYGSDRLKVLQNVLQLFETFLSRLDNYGILSVENRKLYERFLENRSSFQLASSSNFEERRKLKVARYQQEKSLKAKLEVR